jgi:Zn-dependent alcohol dehydrogenase
MKKKNQCRCIEESSVSLSCVSLFRVAIQYAKAMGMRPIAIDLGLEKKEICISHGAELFVDCSPDNPVNIHESINEYTQGRCIIDIVIRCRCGGSTGISILSIRWLPRCAVSRYKSQSVRVSHQHL